MLEANFNPGGVRDTPDERDYQWNNEEFGGTLPPFDWTKGYDVEKELQTVLGDINFVLKPNKQGNSQSCGGQAWSKYAAILNAVIEKKFTENSAKFIYAQTFIPGGSSAGRPNCEVLLKQGCADETLCPSYDNGQPPDEHFMEQPQDITDAAKVNAKFDQTLSYTAVPKTIEDFAHALANNHGMAIGVRGTWVSDLSWNTTYPKPPIGASSDWGHWIYAGKAKLIEGRKMIGLLNSWGEAFGDRGWQWIGEDYFSEDGKYIMGGWTHVLGQKQKTPAGFKHNFLIDLTYGSKSDEVVALQKALQIDGDLPLTVQTTGFYGPATRQAVLVFQIKNTVDSPDELLKLGGNRVGSRTREKLNKLFN